MNSIRTILTSSLLLLTATTVSAWSGQIKVSTPHMAMYLHAHEGEDLRLDYMGATSASSLELEESGDALQAAAIPAFGTADMTWLPALQVEHANGDLNLELVVDKVSTSSDANSKTTIITMKDKLQPFTLRIFYKAFLNADVIETWTEISHHEKGAVRLRRYDSGHIVIPQGDVWLTHLHGTWSAEMMPVNERLAPGITEIKNTDGTRNAHLDAPEIMLSLDGEPNEHTGRAIGAALCWGGNYDIRVSTMENKMHHLYAGIDPQSSQYVLDPGKTFTTPPLALTYSEEGMGGVSRNFHRWARHDGMVHDGTGVRPILLNSWEGIYFDITEERILKMMDDIKSMGGELFVMDDGWFGRKYERNTDNAALGDWVVDTKKLPHGLKALTDGARERGIKFGIWLEPEMTNTKSELFEQHPDWALQVKGRELKKGRGGTQLVLDLTNPKVQDFVYRTIDNLLTANPDIAYIKWDANAPIQNYGSTYEPADRQDNIYVDYHLGLQKVLQRIRKKYPKLIMQDCASGGGRANYGILPYFDEMWVSDNNDPLQRVFIQWGTSYFFPANVMAQHIATSPYYNTGRVTPIKFRCDVAMSGRLGMELQPSKMTEEERRQATTAINDYKALRQTVQQGNRYRLVDPYTHPVAVLMDVDDSRSHAVLFAYRVRYLYNDVVPRVRLQGLDPAASYTLHERDVKDGEKSCSLDGKTFSGRFLMDVGLDIPLQKDYASRVFELTR